MKYPKMVAAAREAAENQKRPYVVYHDLETNEYSYTTEDNFRAFIKISPLIRMLLIMPNGAIVQ